MEIRFMLPGERSVLESYGELHPVAKDFQFVWTRWKKWEADPPIVAVVDGDVAGYHAMSITKSGYVNSTFQFVKSEYRGTGVAGAMVDFMLGHGHDRGTTRLRFRCPRDEDGDAFWRGFGPVPFGYTDKEYWFDLSMCGVACVEDLIRMAPELCGVPAKDKRTLGHYRRSGVQSTGDVGWVEYALSTSKLVLLIEEMVLDNNMADNLEGFWDIWCDLDPDRRLEVLKGKLPKWNYIKLEKQCSFLDIFEVETLVCGMEGDQAGLISKYGISILDDYANAAFNLIV